MIIYFRKKKSVFGINSFNSTVYFPDSFMKIVVVKIFKIATHWPLPSREAKIKIVGTQITLAKFLPTRWILNDWIVLIHAVWWRKCWLSICIWYYYVTSGRQQWLLCVSGGQQWLLDVGMRYYEDVLMFSAWWMSAPNLEIWAPT